MAQIYSPNPVKSRQGCTRFTEDQLKILIKAFNQTPYASYTMKQKLALEVDIEESRISVWFQNRRARCRVWKRSEPEQDFQGSQDKDHPTEKSPSREGRWHGTSHTSSQLHALTSAFTATLTLRLIPESNSLRTLGFHALARVAQWVER